MKLNSFRPDCLILTVTVLLALSSTTRADGFGVVVAPPRYELRADPGDVVREHLEISNPGNRPVTFLLRTADWDMTEDGTATFHPPVLKPDSCRPWIRIERYKIRLPSQGKKRYRFEIHVPEGTPAGECRAALMIEAPPEDAVATRAGTLNLPVRGRIAVVIYLAIGDAKPQLEVTDIVLDKYNEKPAPFLVLHNRGNAHGRTSGFIDATDATGRRIEFEITPLPILPGQTRRVPLYQPVPDGQQPVSFSAPLELKGTVEWEGGREKIQQRLE